VWLAAVLTSVAVADAKGVAQEGTDAIVRNTLVPNTFVPIVVPGAQATGARGINTRGDIVGYFTDASGSAHGFLFVYGSFTSIDVPVPGAIHTVANGINSRGDIVGHCVDSTGVTHGFLLPAHGPFTVIDFKDAIFTTAFGINAAGDIVGQYDTSEKRYGYLLSRAGVFTSIDLPDTQGPSPFGTSAFAINQRGDIVGSFFDGAVHGYLLSESRRCHTHTRSRRCRTTLDVPGGINTQARGITPQGDIVGNYLLGSQIVAFIRDRHGNYESFEAPTDHAASATVAFGINPRGDIVGQSLPRRT
jgi:probable HAF family extracellular repeat protein